MQVPGENIDFDTFPHIVAAGTISISSIGVTAGVTSSNITIPTQPDTNYYVLVTQTSNGAYYASLAATIISETTSKFNLNVFNNGNGTAAASTWNYAVVRDD